MIVDGEIQPDFAMDADQLRDYPFLKTLRYTSQYFYLPKSRKC